MAFFDRARNLARRIGRALSGRQQPPSPAPQQEAARRPIYEAEVPADYLQPTDTGTWVPVTQPTPPQPVPTQPITTPQDWAGYGEEIQLVDALEEEYEAYPPPWPDWEGTFEDWYRLTLELPGSYLREVYGYNNIDILQALEDAGYEIDWDDWKQNYESGFG
jgi:hypothetical protein